jgi:membrane-associated phospholipid phosphatase
LILPTFLVVGAACALCVDCPLARWCLADRLPGDLAKLLSISEAFGHGAGVLLIVLAVHQLDPARRYALPRVLVAAFGSGLGANVIKMLIARTRPHQFDFEGSVATTFSDWAPLASAGSGAQSFPSAHTATAVGLAVALAWLYPRGRGLFAAFAVLVACQRIESGAHFLSDTLCGAAVGFVVSACCFRVGRLPTWFDRFEARWRGDEQSETIPTVTRVGRRHDAA